MSTAAKIGSFSFQGMADFKLSFTKAHEKGISEANSAHLDPIRGLAAFAVLIDHARHILLIDWGQIGHKSIPLKLAYGTTEFGHQAVMVFFILSGFLIGPGVLRSMHAQQWSSARYVLHRFLRLEIVLLPALLLCLFWDLTGIHFFGLTWIYGGNATNYPVAFNIRSCISLPIFLGNTAFLQTLLVPPLGSDSPLWSLANEFWYYLLFPCVALALLSRRRLVVRIASVFLGLSIAWLIRQSILIYFPIWIIGIAVFYLPKLNCRASVKRGLFVVATLLFVIDLLSTKQYWQNQLLSDYVLAVSFAFFLYALLNQSISVSATYFKASHGLAASSYTLYVVHVPILVFIASWMGRRWAPTPLHMGLVFLILCGVWVYAFFVYKMFEAHTREVRKWAERKLNLQERVKVGVPV